MSWGPHGPTQGDVLKVTWLPWLCQKRRHEDTREVGVGVWASGLGAKTHLGVPTSPHQGAWAPAGVHPGNQQGMKAWGIGSLPPAWGSWLLVAGGVWRVTL